MLDVVVLHSVVLSLFLSSCHYYLLIYVLRSCAYLLHVSRVVRQDGQTAMRYAANLGDVSTVRLLLEHGAHVDLADYVSGLRVTCAHAMLAKADHNEPECFCAVIVSCWLVPRTHRVFCGRTGRLC